MIKDFMLIAVNTIGTYVEAQLGVEALKDGWMNRMSRMNRMKGWEENGWVVGSVGELDGTVREVFSREDYVVVDGKARVKFGPYETKAFLIRGS